MGIATVLRDSATSNRFEWLMYINHGPRHSSRKSIAKNKLKECILSWFEEKANKHHMHAGRSTLLVFHPIRVGCPNPTLGSFWGQLVFTSPIIHPPYWHRLVC